MFQRIGRSRWLGLVVGILVLLAWGLFMQRQLDELQRYPWQIRPLAFATGLGAGTLYFGGLAWCWTLLLSHISHSDVQVQRAAAVRAWLLSMMLRYIPGNVWHILSRTAFANSLGVPASHILSSATIEQVLTILGALVLVGLTLPFWGVAPGIEGWFVLLLPVGLLLLHPRIMGRALAWIAGRLNRPELAWDYRYRDIVWLVLAYAGAKLFAGLSLYAIVWGLISVNLAQMPFIIGVAALAWVAGYLSFVAPGGLGVREAIATALLAQVYPLPVAMVASLLFRLVVALGELLAVLVAWVYGRIAIQKQGSST